MKKGIIILLVILAILIAIGTFVYFQFFRTHTKTAYLVVNSPGVEVSTNNGEVWKEAENNMNLKRNYEIRTNNTGSATVIFYDSLIVELKPNTEVEIGNLKKENIELDQKNGSTFSKLSSVLGVEQYSVNTPKAVATIRGTTSGIDINGTTEYFYLIEGDMQLSYDSNTTQLSPLSFVLIKEDGTIESGILSLEQLIAISQDLQGTLNAIKQIRLNELNNNRSTIDSVMQMYNAQESLEYYLDEIDAGRMNDTEMAERSPVNIPSVSKVKNLDDEIKKLNWLVRQINAGATALQIESGINNKVYLTQFN
ncbi:MAG: FecR domain-containing protein [archaeon]